MSTSASYEFIQPLDPIIWGCLPKVNLRKCSGDLLPDLWDLVEYWTAVVSKSWSGDGSEVPEKGMWQRGIFQELFSIPTTLCRAHWQGRACALQAHHAPFQSTVGQITSPKAFPARRKLCVPSATRPYPLFCFAVIYLVPRLTHGMHFQRLISNWAEVSEWHRLSLHSGDVLQPLLALPEVLSLRNAPRLQWQFANFSVILMIIIINNVGRTALDLWLHVVFWQNKMN